MKKIFFIVTSVLFTLSAFGCVPTDNPNFPAVNKLTNSSQSNASQTDDTTQTALSEYCFTITKEITIGVKNVANNPLAPRSFLQSTGNENILAAINGVYWGADDGQPQGIVYFNGEHLASKKGSIRGYFTVNKKGDEIKVAEKLQGDLQDYRLVIGTHPLLVTKGKTNFQAKEVRYNLDSGNQPKQSFRSAIGTKDGANICFAVSRTEITMADWAQLLIDQGYQGAINLDGGPISQLAVRGEPAKGGGFNPTRLLIFAYQREE